MSRKPKERAYDGDFKREIEELLRRRNKRYLRRVLESAYLGKRFVLLFGSKLKANRASYEIKNLLVGSEKTFQPYILRKDSFEVGLGRVEIASSERELRGRNYDFMIVDEADIIGRGSRC